VSFIFATLTVGSLAVACSWHWVVV